LSASNPTSPELRSSPGFGGDRSETNCLIQGTTSNKKKILGKNELVNPMKA